MTLTLGHFLGLGAILFALVGYRYFSEPQKPDRFVDGH
jgi:hypothetical protein